jgi:2-keto-4-pentenoate hydratase/2-oxohepta-3-ene-1,7-dioic acid hydratase in catechol pathway
MKLVTYRSRTGDVRHGRLDGEDSIVDLGPGDLLSYIEAGGKPGQDGEVVSAGQVRLLAPLRRPPKLLALAGNYQDHITESGAPRVDKSRIVPKLFLKPSSAIVGPDEALCLPTVSHETDWELELAVVIGRRARNVSVDQALDYVFGYTIANDVSARSADWGVQREDNRWNDFFDWLNGKWPDGFAPLGPYLVTADEIPDPQVLDMRLTVNGEQRQCSNTPR